MIQEIKGNYIVRSFLSLNNFYNSLRVNTDPKLLKEEMMAIPLRKMPSSDFNYLLVDLYEWISIIESSREFREKIPNSSRIIDLCKENEEIIRYTSYRITNPTRIKRVMSEFLSTDKLSGLFELYELFAKYLEDIQIKYLKIYDNNVATSPTMFIPFSYGLNRLTDSIYLIKESNDIDLDNLNKSNFEESDLEVEGVTHKYSISDNYISDGMNNRVPLISPVQLFYSYTNELNENGLPPRWREIFDLGIVKRDTDKYLERLRLINLVYSQYKFIGRSSIGGNKKMLLNYPLLLPSAVDINVSSSIIITPKMNNELSRVFGEEN